MGDAYGQFQNHLQNTFYTGKVHGSAGYIKGVKIQKYVAGGTSVDIDDIRITLKGLEYLSENSIMQRLYKAAKGITELVP